MKQLKRLPGLYITQHSFVWQNWPNKHETTLWHLKTGEGTGGADEWEFVISTTLHLWNQLQQQRFSEETDVSDSLKDITWSRPSQHTSRKALATVERLHFNFECNTIITL